jgi:hypothetical protein
MMLGLGKLLAQREASRVNPGPSEAPGPRCAPAAARSPVRTL